MADPVVRRLLPANRNDHVQRWEITYDGTVIGWLQAHRIGQARNVFYEAVGIAPTGEAVVLESHTEFQNRVDVIVEFHNYPQRYRGVHWHPRRSPQ